jgi:predicted ATPase
VRALPSGTVTFLFTDIEGSTRLLHELGDAYAAALAEHRRVLREAFARHGGVEVDTQGDAFFVGFTSAPAAAAAAEEAQAALAGGPIQVRMGLHTGTPTVAEEGYVGLDVHLGARVAACGHGGQVLLSKATVGLVEGELTDLGEHRLKDFEQPVWLYQLGDARFPPLKTISNTNLPRPASSFVGREREVSEVLAVLRDGARLVTLTGPGGSGKTRLAIEAATEVIGDFANGVYWIQLADIRDPSLVMPEIGQTVGASGSVAEGLAGKRALLLLDNFEHVVEAAPAVAELVETCPTLVMLVTSREPLRVRGEVRYELDPLEDADAVALFCERARVSRTDAIVALCRRLDNLPLALELAAARMALLSPEQILQRLSQRLDLFRGGRDVDARQRTLRGTIEWSVNLLSEEDERLFGQLAVFVGGCTVDAAEVVCEADLDALQSLVEKSLVRRTGDRCWMLETIREYALERLAASPDPGRVHRRHAEYFLGLAEHAEDDFEGAVTRDHVTRELPNFRAAVAHAEDAGDAVLEFALLGHAGALMRDSFSRYRSRLEALLTRAEDAPPRTRVRAVHNLAFATYRSGDFEGGLGFAQTEHELATALGDPRLVGMALNSIAAAQLALKDASAARAALEEAALLLDQAGDLRAAAATKVNLADVLLAEGEYPAAERLCDEAVPAFARVGDPDGSMTARINGATASVLAGMPHAASRVAAILEDARSLDDSYALAVVLQLAAAIAAQQEDVEHALAFVAASDALRSTVGAALEPTEERVHELVLSRVGRELPAGDPADAAMVRDQATVYLEGVIGIAPRTARHP